MATLGEVCVTIYPDELEIRLELSGEVVVTRGADAAWQVVDDKVVVVTPRSREIHILDGTGGTIWNRISEPATLSAVVDAVCEEYDVDRETAERETREFVSDLVEKGVVSIDG